MVRKMSRILLSVSLLIASFSLFFGGICLQMSLFHKISQHHRATVVPNVPSEVRPRATAARARQKLGRCAINLYGLPRAFETLVLPSLLKNVIQTNAAYHCDYFVHYYNLTHEGSGRSGAGGVLNPHEVRLLTHAVRQYNEQATVEYTMDEEEYFWDRYSALLKRIHTTMDGRGKFLYYPWKARTYKHPTVDNIIKMWHSIEQAWNTMEAHAQRENILYTRVAMLRSDVVYMTPIDIWETQHMGVPDTENNLAIIPGFGRYPVSDRMIYGPYNAVKEWSTSRFASLDRHVRWVLENARGWGMHSENFVNFTLLPNVRRTGARVTDHLTMCFFRARPDETVWINDCDGPPNVASREIYKHLNTDRRQAVEEVLGRPCPGPIHRITRKFSALDCKRNATTT